MLHTIRACAGLLALAPGCAAIPGPAAAPVFQIQRDSAAPLDADAGPAPSGEAGVMVEADAPFRLRMAARSQGEPLRLALEYRRNAGPWTPVEAHDFPLPERELSLTFDDVASGATPPGWRTLGDIALSVAETGAGPVLRARAGEAPGYAFLTSPWPLDGFSFAADLELRGPAEGGLALVFAHEGPGDEARLVLDAEAGVLRLVRVRNGAVEPLAETAAAIAPSARIRVEVQSEDGLLEAEIGDGAAQIALPRPSGLPAQALGLRLPAGGEVDIHRVELAGEASTPRVSLVSSPAFNHGAATAPVFAGDTPGFAVSTSETSPVWSAGQGELGEFVWSLVIRRFADGAAVNADGDVFEFRMVDAAGRRAQLGDGPAVILHVPDGHLGGTFVETPGRIGPFLSEAGALYFLMEPAETDNLFMMVKSEDGGRSWREVDGAGRPITGDLEAVDARLVDGVIHILHQITEALVHHGFDTRDDRWTFTDAPVAEVEAVSQMASLAARGEAGLVAVFLGDQLYYALRAPGGAWSAPAVLDGDAGVMTVGPQAVTGAGDAVHIAYADTAGALWLRTLQADGRLSSRMQIAQGAVTGEADYGAVLPLVHLEETDTLVIAYRLADGTLWERRLSEGGLSDPARIAAGPVITNAVDAQQAAADIVADGETLHVLFVDADTRSIYSVHECGAGWGEPVLRVDAIEGSWVRGEVHPDGEGGSVYRYVYDAGSRGGSGLNRYGEIALGMCE